MDNEVILIKDQSRQEGYEDIQQFLFSCGCKWQYSVNRQQLFDLDASERIFIVSLSDGMMSHKQTRKKMKDVAQRINETVVGMYNFRWEQKEIAYKIHTYDNELVVDDNTQIDLPYERWERLRDVMDTMDDIRRNVKVVRVTDKEFELVKDTVMGQSYRWAQRMELNRLYHRYKDKAKVI